VLFFLWLKINREPAMEPSSPPPPFHGHNHHADEHLPDDLEGMEAIMDDLISLGSPRMMSLSSSHEEDEGSPEYWRLSNFVQMEIQENAKLPSFYGNVDRSGSSSLSNTRPGGIIANIPAPAQSPEQRMLLDSPSPSSLLLLQPKLTRQSSASLMEAFFQSENRMARHVNYAHVGVLKQDTTQKLLQDDFCDATTAAITTPTTTLIDPTPLSEIRQKLKLPFPPSQSQAQYQPRQDPLPIPTMHNQQQQQQQSQSELPSSLPTNNLFSIPNEESMPAPASIQRHALAHAQPKPALVAAPTRTYGFGKKHIVPSVPSVRPLPSNNNTATNTSNLKRPLGDAPPGEDAYERKKRRAKHARVKLNESIDRLAANVNFVGNVAKNSRIPMLQEWGYETTLAQQCVRIAGDAKKWDRPSFVGTAASLVANLNSQCEALMREIQILRQNHAATMATVDENNNIKPSLAGTSNDPGEIHSNSDNNNNDEVPLFVGKSVTPEVSVTDENSLSDMMTTADSMVFSDRGIMVRVASFLEPRSILRCMRVSKIWHDWGIFSNDELWQKLAVARFGAVPTRQWKGNLDDEELGLQASYSTVYRRMDSANVIPHFAHRNLFLLGEARLPSRVSAWTFLVERSNGETMRSVRRRPPDTKVQQHAAVSSSYTSIPVVTLWTVIQNTGLDDQMVVIRDQTQTIDASTRRRRDEMAEIDWDDRYQKRILNLDGTLYTLPTADDPIEGFQGRVLCQLRLFDAVILETNIHARGCSTTSKFVQRSSFTVLHVQIRDNITVPLVIPFPRDATPVIM
jgi:hypothetical protein